MEASAAPPPMENPISDKPSGTRIQKSDWINSASELWVLSQTVSIPKVGHEPDLRVASLNGKELTIPEAGVPKLAGASGYKPDTSQKT